MYVAIIVGGLLSLKLVPHQVVSHLLMTSACLSVIGCCLVVHYYETCAALYGPTQHIVSLDAHLTSDKYYIRLQNNEICPVDKEMVPVLRFVILTRRCHSDRICFSYQLHSVRACIVEIHVT
jgi:hypothetical protein